MSDNVVKFTGETCLDLDPDQVIRESIGCFGECVFIVGYDAEGNFDMRGSMASGPTLLWLLETAKKELLHTLDE